MVTSCTRAFRLRRQFSLAAAALLVCLVIRSNAQVPQGVVWSPYDLPQLQQTTLTSAGGASYRIIVAKPDGPAPANGYPVIYVVDGNAYTAIVSEIIRYNRDVGVQSRVEPAVVVGIGYPTGDAYDLTRRTLDFTSRATANHPGVASSSNPTGGDVALMDFIERSVKPLVETTFHVDRTRQTLIGHSLGGLFTLEMMIDRPGSFQTYVAISPSIWWNSDALLGQMQQFLDARKHLAKLRVFLSIGLLEQYMTPDYIARTRYLNRDASKPQAATDAEADRDDIEMKAKTMVSNAQRMAKIFKAAHVETKFMQFSDQDHFSVVPEALGDAIPFALADNLPIR